MTESLEIERRCSYASVPTIKRFSQSRAIIRGLMGQSFSLRRGLRLLITHRLDIDVVVRGMMRMRAKGRSAMDFSLLNGVSPAAPTELSQYCPKMLKKRPCIK